MTKKFLLERRFRTPLPTRRADSVARRVYRVQTRRSVFRRLLRPETRSALEWSNRRDRQLRALSDVEFMREAERIRANSECRWAPSDCVYDATLYYKVVPMLIERLRTSGVRWLWLYRQVRPGFVCRPPGPARVRQ
jgi:hypothetical protein